LPTREWLQGHFTQRSQEKVVTLPWKLFEMPRRRKQREKNTSILDKELFHSGPNKH